MCGNRSVVVRRNLVEFLKWDEDAVNNDPAFLERYFHGDG